MSPASARDRLDVVGLIMADRAFLDSQAEGATVAVSVRAALLAYIENLPATASDRDRPSPARPEPPVDEALLREAFHTGAENGYLFGGEGEALTVDHLDELFDEWRGVQTDAQEGQNAVA